MANRDKSPGVDPSAIALMTATPASLRSLLSRLPPELLNEPNPEGWSLKDIVAHLLDVEAVAFVERIERMLQEDRPYILSIDPPARLIAGGYAARGLDELLDELEQQRREHAAWLSGLTGQELLRAGEHDSVGEILVVDIAHQWAAHDVMHLRQIALMIQGHIAPKMGNTRSFYDV